MEIQQNIKTFALRRVDMNCDLCGKEAELVRAQIEGSELTVCLKCARHGKTVGKVIPPRAQQKAEVRPQSQMPLHAISHDFARLIKHAREKLNLKQEELAKAISEKESLIHKLETGSVVPSPALAKKLESFLKIKLIEEYHEESDSMQKSKSAELTMGDFIKAKKR